MDQSVDRRQVLKMGAGAAAVAAAASVLPVTAADAAPKAPKKVAIGTMALERLWGYYYKYSYVYETVNGKRRRKTIKTKVLRTRSVWSGTDKTTLNKGGMCHWIGTASPLGKGNCVMFGHRTSAGGLLRNVHKIKIGDLVVLTINGQGSKTYQVVDLPPVIGSRDFASAINWGDKSKSNLTLVACTKTNRLPTSTKFRLLVRCTEV